MSEYQHKDLAAGQWAELSLATQMVNIGSEISRANRWKAKGAQDHCVNAVYRALELISLTIDAQQGKHSLTELTRLYEFVADYYLGDQIYPVDGAWLQKYFDSFIYQYLKEMSQ